MSDTRLFECHLSLNSLNSTKLGGGRTRGAHAGAHKGRTRQNKIVQNLACQDQNVHTKSDEETAENVADNLVDTARLRIDAASVTRVQSNHATLNLPI